jgi:hypothetical protein
MSNEVSSNNDAAQASKKQGRTVIITALVLIVLCVLFYAGYTALGNNVEATYIEIRCREMNPELGDEECSSWVQSLKRDHAEDYAACNNPNTRGVSGDAYGCFVGRGLGPQQ